MSYRDRRSEPARWNTPPCRESKSAHNRRAVSTAAIGHRNSSTNRSTVRPARQAAASSSLNAPGPEGERPKFNDVRTIACRGLRRTQASASTFVSAYTLKGFTASSSR